MSLGKILKRRVKVVYIYRKHEQVQEELNALFAQYDGKDLTIDNVVQSSSGRMDHQTTLSIFYSFWEPSEKNQKTGEQN